MRLHQVFPAFRVVVRGHAYVLGPAGLRILDVSDPRHPLQVGSYDIRYGEDVAVDGRRAYVSDGATLRILDVTDPRHPVLPGSPFAIGSAARVAVAGHYVYVADRGDAQRQGNLRVVDVADPARPVEVGTLPLSSPLAGAIAGRYVYVGMAGIVDVIDVSKPTHQQLVSSLRSVAGLPFDPVLDGDYTFVADGFGVALQIGDVTDLSNPRLIATLGVPTNAEDVSVATNYAYVAARSRASRRGPERADGASRGRARRAALGRRRGVLRPPPLCRRRRAGSADLRRDRPDASARDRPVRD